MQMNDGVIKLSNIPDGGGSGEGVVHIEGQETITGSKTFSANTYIGSVGEPADLGIVGDLNIQGDIIQNGSAYETHAEKIYTKNDYITLRDGAESGLLSGDYSGFQVEKYDGTNDGRLVIDNTGTARVGDVGDEQPLLTRDESVSLTDDGLLIWDSANSKAVNLSTITTDALGNLTATSFNGNATSATKATNDGANNNIVDTYANRLIGNVSDNIEVYNKLEEDYHSTFDISKFTITGTPTINNGVASGFSNNNKIIATPSAVTSLTSSSILEFEMRIDIGETLPTAQTTLATIGTSNREGATIKTLSGGIAINGNNRGANLAQACSYNVTANTSYICYGKVNFAESDGSGHTGSIYGEIRSLDGTVLASGKSFGGEFSSIWFGINYTNYNQFISFGTNNDSSYEQATDLPIDLKQFSLSVDGVPAFSGNQTSVDTYTINSETVSIPYTLSSTNDKIVDIYYLNRVQDATDYLGYNNYALIDETDKEFIIPQGYEFNKIYNIQGILGDVATLLSEV